MPNANVSKISGVRLFIRGAQSAPFHHNRYTIHAYTRISLRSERAPPSLAVSASHRAIS
jgi:hypothetical protein